MRLCKCETLFLRYRNIWQTTGVNTCGVGIQQSGEVHASAYRHHDLRRHGPPDGNGGLREAEDHMGLERQAYEPEAQQPVSA